MGIIFLPILLATIASVLCEPRSSVSSILERPDAPSLSDSASSNNASPYSSPLPNFSLPGDDSMTPTAPPEPCNDPPCNVFVIQMDPDETDVQKTVDEAFGDRVVRWLVVAKTTHIDKIEEISDDFATGKKKKVSSENRVEQLKVLRDSRHAFFGNEFDLVSVFK